MYIPIIVYVRTVVYGHHTPMRAHANTRTVHVLPRAHGQGVTHIILVRGWRRGSNIRTSHPPENHRKTVSIVLLSAWRGCGYHHKNQSQFNLMHGLTLYHANTIYTVTCNLITVIRGYELVYFEYEHNVELSNA